MAGAFVVYRTLLVSVPKAALGRVPALYVIGAVAAYWSIGRVVSIVS